MNHFHHISKQTHAKKCGVNTKECAQRNTCNIRLKVTKRLQSKDLINVLKMLPHGYPQLAFQNHFSHLRSGEIMSRLRNAEVQFPFAYATDSCKPGLSGQYGPCTVHHHVTITTRGIPDTRIEWLMQETGKRSTIKLCLNLWPPLQVHRGKLMFLPALPRRPNLAINVQSKLNLCILVITFSKTISDVIYYWLASGHTLLLHSR
jgi:hypothetical protein